jgi:hypothetical protein
MVFYNEAASFIERINKFRYRLILMLHSPHTVVQVMESIAYEISSQQDFSFC